MPGMKLGLRVWARAICLGAVYFGLCALSVTLTRFDGGAAIVWPATAPLLAYLLSRPDRDWMPAILCCGIGSWIASSIFALGVRPGALIALSVMAEALIAAKLLRRWSPDVSAFDSLSSVGVFALVAGVIAPVLTGIPAGGAIAYWSGRAFLPIWGGWWAAHALGTITFAPVLLLALRKDVWWELKRPDTRHVAEAAGLFAIVALVTLIVFGQQTMPLLFLPLLPLLLITFRLGRPGAATSIVLFACIGAVLTARGLGPISLMHGSISARAEFFQFYIAIAVLTVLPAAAELRRRERLFLRLQESEARYRLLSDKSGDPVIHLSPEGEVRFASPAIMALTGYRPEDVIGRSASDFVMGEDYPKFDEARMRALSDTEATITVEYRANTRDRGFEWRETQMRSYADERGMAAGIVIVIRDISRRKLAEAELEQAATTDELTGLPNRRPFFEQLERLAAFAETSRPSSVALFDIDFFKRVNDLHGHSIGDAVLRSIASAARERPRFGPRERIVVPEGATIIRHTEIGRITHVDVVQLADVAKRIGAEITLAALPGTLVDPARLLAWTVAPIDDRQLCRIRDAFTLEHHRAFDHDPRFGLVVLSEIASRALSPAVNDPGTAIAVIEAGTRVVAAILRLELDPDRATPKGVNVPPFAFTDLLEDLYRPIARDGAGTIEVGIRLQKALAALPHIDSEAAGDCRAEAADVLDRATQACASEADRGRLGQIHARYWHGDDGRPLDGSIA